MTTVKLTARQEAFAQGLIAGKTQYQAYIDAGYATKGKSRSYIDKEASNLAKNSKIIGRLSEFKDKVYQEQLYTLKDAIRELNELKEYAKTDIEEKGFTAGAGNVINGAIKQQCELLGLSEQKIKISGELNNPIKDLTTDELRQLIK